MNVPLTSAADHEGTASAGRPWGYLMTGDEEMQIPVGWLQRMSKREFVAFIGACVAVGSWGYAVNGDIASLKDRAARAEAKLEAFEAEYAKRDKDMSITMATLGVSLMTIDKRLTSIEQNVRKMAQ